MSCHVKYHVMYGRPLVMEGQCAARVGVPVGTRNTAFYGAFIPNHVSLSTRCLVLGNDRKSKGIWLTGKLYLTK